MTSGESVVVGAVESALGALDAGALEAAVSVADPLAPPFAAAGAVTAGSGAGVFLPADFAVGVLVLAAVGAAAVVAEALSEAVFAAAFFAAGALLARAFVAGVFVAGVFVAGAFVAGVLAAFAAVDLGAPAELVGVALVAAGFGAFAGEVAGLAFGDAGFDAACFDGAAFDDAALDGAGFDDAGLDGALAGAAFDGAALVGAIAGAALDDAALDDAALVGGVLEDAGAEARFAVVTFWASLAIRESMDLTAAGALLAAGRATFCSFAMTLPGSEVPHPTIGHFRDGAYNAQPPGLIPDRSARV